MKRTILTICSVLFAWQASAESPVRSGAYYIQPEGYHGYIMSVVLNDKGTTAGDFNRLSLYPAGSHFFIYLRLRIEGGAATSVNLNIPIDTKMCNRMIDEIEKNKTSIIKHRLSGDTEVKPVNKPFPKSVSENLLQKRSISYPEAVVVPTKQIAADSALCFAGKSLAGQSSGKFLTLEAWVAYTL